MQTDHQQLSQTLSNVMKMNQTRKKVHKEKDQKVSNKIYNVIDTIFEESDQDNNNSEDEGLHFIDYIDQSKLENQLTKEERLALNLGFEEKIEMATTGKSKSKQKQKQKSKKTTSTNLNKGKTSTTKQESQKMLSEEKSYINLFKQYIYDQDYWPNIKPKDKFYLIEDIALLYFISLSDELNIGRDFFNELKNQEFFPNRNAESLRERYRKFLIYLDSLDLCKINTWILEQGIKDSFLVFKMIANPLKKLDKISKGIKSVSDSNIPNQLKKQLTNKLDTFKLVRNKKLKDKEIQKEISKSYTCFCSNKYVDELINTNQKTIHELCPDSQGYFDKLEAFSNLNLALYTYELDASGKRKLLIDTLKMEETFQGKLQFYTTQYNKSESFILTLLEDVSGSWEDLYQILEHNENHLKWSEDDDNVLEAIKDGNNPLLKLLIRLKGKLSVYNRIKYKNLQFDFEF